MRWCFFFFQAEDGIRDRDVTGVQTVLFRSARVADLTVAGCLLAVSEPSSGKTNSHGVTGGVYKARERIHRGMLIHDY